MGEEGDQDVNSDGFCLPGIEDDDDRRSESSSFYGDSDDSILSSTSSDLADDATYSSPSSSSPSSFDLSSLVAELPVKRGLSRYFEGKSESFRSLSEVRCVEDLVKQETPSRKRLKASGDYGFNSTKKQCNKPRFHGRTISKKTSKGSSVSWRARRNRNGGLQSSKMPSLPLHENLHNMFASPY